MFLLTADETSAISDAVQYYDCAGLPSAIQKMQKIENQDVVILSKEEVQKLKTYILDMEDAVFNGAFAPPTLSFLSQLCDFAEKEPTAYVEEDGDIRSKTVFSAGLLSRVNELLD